MSGSELPRYFVEKKQKGHSLYYWQPGKALLRSGFKTVPLGKDRTAAIKQAEAINAKVDQWRGGQPVLAKTRHGTLPWLIEVYENSSSHHALADSTKTAYSYWHARILRWSAARGDPPMSTITRLDAEHLLAELRHTPTRASHIISRCKFLWQFADDLDMDIVHKNPFKRVKLPTLCPRDEVWLPEQIAAVIETALSWRRPGTVTRRCGPRPSIALATLIARNTAQREGDILSLLWRQYDGRSITLTQGKTGTTLTIPCTEELKRALDDARSGLGAGGKVVALPPGPDRPIVENEATGRRYDRAAFAQRFRIIANAAGVPPALQFRDLRRTATVRLAEAGCSEAEIAAFGGWSASSVSQMMKVYRPLNVTMANNGLIKLEDYLAGAVKPGVV